VQILPKWDTKVAFCIFFLAKRCPLEILLLEIIYIHLCQVIFIS